MDDRKTTKETPREKPDRIPIPVAHIVLPPGYTARGLDTSSVTDQRESPNQPYRVDYLPWMRHFRIEMLRPGHERVLMVHETHVRGWEELSPTKR